MNFVQFHVGDWDSSTRLLSPLEKGVYIDLLMLYYSVERPLMRSECERIARAYADDERAALNYVLDRFFDLRGDSYAHHRCDEEIALCREKSAKAAKSAQARWNKASRASSKSDADALAMQNGSTCSAVASANGMRTHSERNADGMLTNNQEPVTNKKEINIYAPDGACVSEASIPDAESIPENLPNDLHSAAAETVDDFALDAEVPAVASEVKKPVREKKACCPVPKPAGLSDEDWAEYKRLRKQKRLPLTTRAWNKIEAEAQKAGKTIVEVIHICLEHSWAGYDSTWPLNSAERNSAGQSQKVFAPPSRFDEIDYSAGINPDGSF